MQLTGFQSSLKMFLAVSHVWSETGRDVCGPGNNGSQADIPLEIQVGVVDLALSVLSSPQENSEFPCYVTSLWMEGPTWVMNQVNDADYNRKHGC